ncbi:MAG: ABC transporter permease subunit [Candidatus Poseidoniia archaeon]|nr:ABC transporter permease subunit [Candidatus Poseidoniia archaeon]
MIERIALILILTLVLLPFFQKYLSSTVFYYISNTINYSLFASIYYILADSFVENTLLNLTPNRIQNLSIGFNVLPEAVDLAWIPTIILSFVIALGFFLLQNGNITPRRYDLSIQFLAILAFLPFVLYFWTHILYLKENDSSWIFDLVFMEEMAGFTLSNEWPFQTVLQDTRWQFYRVGLLNAIRVVILSIIGSTIVGVLVGVSRLSRNRLLSSLAESYVEFFRNMPLVVQLFFLYTVVLGANLPTFEFIQDNTLFGWVYWSNRGIVGPGATIENMQYLLAVIVVYLGARTYIRLTERILPKTSERFSVDSIGKIIEDILGDDQINKSRMAVAVDIFFSISILIVMYGLFNIAEWNYKISFIEGILENDPLSMFKLGIILFTLSALLRFKLDSLGLNNFTADDSVEGQRNRLYLWSIIILLMFVLFYFAILFKQPNLITEKPNGDQLGWGLWTFEEGTDQTISSVFLTLWIGLTLYTAAQIAEIVRGSIQSLPRGQVEAAISLGLSPYQRLNLIILPQALRSMIPSMTNQYLNCWKNSSLAFVVGFSDFYAVFTTIVNNVGQAVPVFLMILATYQAGSLIISAIMNYINSNVTKVKI